MDREQKWGEMMKLGEFEIGKKTFIIAEIGNNHNGDFKTAEKLVHEAVKAGADAVKFQTFNPDLYVDPTLKTIAHVRGASNTQHERLTTLKLEYDEFRALKGLADELGILFLSTPFDKDAVDFLDELVPAFKVASGDLTNIPLLERVASKGKPVILSTGMGDEMEIERALNIFDRENIILLHCVARYPTPVEGANMLSIPYLRDKFRVPVGYSDHSIGLTSCIVAASLGAVVIEKHFTLDKEQPVGDHKISMNPVDLSELVRDVRDIELSLGNYCKPVDAEKEAAKVMRRSLYAGSDILKGSRLSLDMMVALRPGWGIPTIESDSMVGKTATEDIKKDTLLTRQMFK